MKSLRSVACLSLLFLLICAAPASSVPIYFTDRVAFDLATGGGLNFESFETLPLPGFADTIVFSGFTVSEIGNDVPSLNSLGVTNLAPTDGTYSLGYYNNGPSKGRFYNFASLTNAFGLDLVNFGKDSNTTVTISGSAEFVLDLTAAMPQFWGVIDTDGITSLEFFFSGGQPDSGGGFPQFDAVSFGLTASAPVPEPATMLLLGAGLIGIAGFSRKKRL